MSLLEKYMANIENAIQKLAIDPKTCRTEQSYKWYLHRGNADIVVFLRESSTFSENIRHTIVIASPILRIDESIGQNKYMELQAELLNINHKFIMERFSIENGIVYITNTVYADEMDVNALAFHLDSLSFYAQAFADDFALRYGAKTTTTIPTA